MNTTVKVLATGSDGNCVYVGTEGASILIDVGLPKTRIEKVMLERDIDPTKIDAIYISHEHQDHCKGIGFADKYNIPVYASEGTLKALKRLDSGKIIKAGGGIVHDAVSTNFLQVIAFNISHDAMEPLGYTIQTADKKVSVLMDTGCVTNDMLRAMDFSDIFVFECNHDLDMLQNGKYDDFVKSRIASDIGHLSNDQAAEALAKLVKGRGEQIFLTHMSSNNNTPALAEKAVKLALFEKGFVKNKHYKVEVI